MHFCIQPAYSALSILINAIMIMTPLGMTRICDDKHFMLSFIHIVWTAVLRVTEGAAVYAGNERQEFTLHTHTHTNTHHKLQSPVNLMCIVEETRVIGGNLHRLRKKMQRSFCRKNVESNPKPFTYITTSAYSISQNKQSHIILWHELHLSWQVGEQLL